MHPTRALCWCLLLLFLAVGLSRLRDRPMHNDESVNAMLLRRLVERGAYRYDPEHFHGPSLYLLHALPARLCARVFGRGAGVGERALRGAVVVCGGLILAGFAALSGPLGPWGSLAGLVLLGVSPDFLYYSRYFIHETLFVLSGFGTFLALLFFLETRRGAPRPSGKAMAGRGAFLAAGMAAAALFFCTKETAVLQALVMAASCIVVPVVRAFLDLRDIRAEVALELRRAGDLIRENVRALLAGSALAVLIWVVMYSSFFTNWRGLPDSFRFLGAWGREGLGEGSGHVKPFYYYLKDILLPYEPHLALFGGLGVAAALWTRDRLGLYLASWAAGTLFLYSVIPYKTPWLALDMLLPLALAAGFGVQQVARWIESGPRDGRRKAAARLAAAFLVLAGAAAWRSARLAFLEFDDPRHPQVYTQPDRDILRLVRDIESYALRSPAGRACRIEVLSEEVWPLPYYLREFPGFRHRPGQDGRPVDAPLVVAYSLFRGDVAKLVRGPRAVEQYKFRTGVLVDLYVAEELLGGPAVRGSSTR
ncbi:MAG: TIGR03663 family protein [Elusimicrobia bacterium]|nr:TIGR03663 family protein [Elusimicrobiota bacterium]